MSDLNKLQNMDHQELTNAGQRPEDQEYDNRAGEPSQKEPKSGLTTPEDNLDTDTDRGEQKPSV